MVQQATTLPVVRDVWVPMSYEEWLEWAPDNQFSEWVDGKGVIFVPSNEEHQWVALLFYELLSRYARLFDLGNVITAPYHVKLWERGPAREPDVIFVAKEHLHRWTPTRVLGGVTLALEVISPESVYRDRIEKYQDYARAGIPEYLLIDARPGHFSFQLFRLDASGEYQQVAPDAEGRVHFNTLPGFWVDPSWFTESPLRSAESLMVKIAGQAYIDWLMKEIETR
jgi:Uma2 family endonuclease